MVGAKPRLEQEFDLTTVDPEGRVQVRIDKNNAPREMVERFAGQMSFSVFPPIVVTEDARIIDGNTRFQRTAKREERFRPALVVPVSWDDADEEMRLRLEYLGLALNNSNGKALDRSERRKMVRDALELGMTSRQITATVGFPTQRRQRHPPRARGRGQARAGRPQGRGGASATRALRALGKAADLNDQPFRELARLATEAGFNAGEIRRPGGHCARSRVRRAGAGADRARARGERTADRRPGARRQRPSRRPPGSFGSGSASSRAARSARSSRRTASGWTITWTRSRRRSRSCRPSPSSSVKRSPSMRRVRKLSGNHAAWLDDGCSGDQGGRETGLPDFLCDVVPGQFATRPTTAT